MPGIWIPENSQETIQDFIIDLWLQNPTSELDGKRAQYVSTYCRKNDGWCDGWSYALSQKGDKLAEIWKEIDQACTSRSSVTSSTAYEAMILARSAALYHVTNNAPPPTGTQLNAYQDAGFDREQTPAARETWKHEYGKPLELHVIKEEIGKLTNGQTLRLTSDHHDAAVKRTRAGYVVCETEEHGVQLCTRLDDAMGILKNWQDECRSKRKNFFSQTMVVSE